MTGGVGRHAVGSRRRRERVCPWPAVCRTLLPRGSALIPTLVLALILGGTLPGCILDPRLQLSLQVLPSGAPASDSATFKLTVVNQGFRPAKLSFGTSQVYDFLVMNQGGSLVWRWGAGKSFLQIIQTIALQPGEAVSYEESWDLRASDNSRVPPGIYAVTAQLRTWPWARTVSGFLVVGPAP
ncbi:MAG: hypothetical protein HYY08_00480 [Firmicutes bacterium]|nr:hypothetical protein [Bacillota bacterium]